MNLNPVQVVQDRNSLYCNTWWPDLHPALSYTKTEQERVRGRMKFIRYDVPMYQLRNGGAAGLFVYGGLYKALFLWMESKGIQYEVKDVRPPLPSPDLSGVISPKERQKIVLAKLFTSHCGIFKCPPGFGKSYIISMLPIVYKPLHILIISTSGKVVRQLFERTRDMCNNNGHMLSLTQLGGDRGKKMYKDGDTVIISTAASCHKIDAEWPDMVIYDEVHGAATDRIRSVLQEFSSNDKRARMFGFSASPTGRLDGADIAVTAAFGPILVDIPYKDSVEQGDVVPMEVHTFPVPDGCAHVEPNWDNARKERALFWLNTVRNNRVRAAYDKLFTPDEQVIILVKVTEHVMELRKQFPGALLVYNDIDAKKFAKYVERGVMSADEDHMRKADPDPETAKQLFAQGKHKVAIATTMWKEGIDFPDLAGLIRADGMRGSIAAIQIGGRASRTNGGVKTHAKLVDFRDKYTPSVADKYRDRLKHYVAEQWEIIDHEDF